MCGESSIAVLGFHHTGGKQNELSSMFGACSWEEIEKELNKTILLCENCHRKMHGSVDSEYARVKNLCLDYKGTNACSKCGYDEFTGALDFCVKDTKNSGLVRISKLIEPSWETIDDFSEKILDALDMRKVLCGNCHMKERFKDESRFKFFKKEIYKKEIVSKSTKPVVYNNMIRYSRFTIGMHPRH